MPFNGPKAHPTLSGPFPIEFYTYNNQALKDCRGKSLTLSVYPMHSFTLMIIAEQRIDP